MQYTVWTTNGRRAVDEYTGTRRQCIQWLIGRYGYLPGWSIISTSQSETWINRRLGIPED